MWPTSIPMPLDLPLDHTPSAYVASQKQTVLQSDAENVAAAAWLDLRQDGAFKRFCRDYDSDPDSLTAHPDGSFSLQSPVPHGMLVTFFRPFGINGQLAVPFSEMADAFRWRPSLDVLLRHTYALNRDVGRDDIGVSRINGVEAMDMLLRAGPVATDAGARASAFKFLDVFSALYRGDEEQASPPVTLATFSHRFQADANLRYLAGWITSQPADTLPPRAALKAVGKLARMVQQAYVADLPLSTDESTQTREYFIDYVRRRVAPAAVADHIRVAPGTIDFAADVLYWTASDEARMRPLPLWPVQVPVPPETPYPFVDSRAPTPASVDNPAPIAPARSRVNDTEHGIRHEGREHADVVSSWPMVAKVTTFGGGVVVLSASVSTGLTAVQKAAVVSVGNAASLAGVSVLAIVAPGVGHTLGVVGTSGLLYASIADYLASAGVAPALAKSAAIVEVSGVYILVGVGLGDSTDALLALARNPGWREALRLSATILATIGTMSAGAPAADKADTFNVDDARYGFFSEHPDLSGRLGHSGNGVVLVSQGVLQTTDDTVSRRDGERSFWDIFLSSYDPSGTPRGTLSQ